MIINDDILRRDTVQLLKKIETQIDKAEAQDNQLELSFLLAAKATAYNTLVVLQKK
jgi:hypothetical protein